MQIGPDKISATQQEYLAKAKGNPSPFELAEIFLALVRDSDLLSGKEHIHPEWLDIYENNKSTLKRSMPANIFGRIDTFCQNIERSNLVTFAWRFFLEQAHHDLSLRTYPPLKNFFLNFLNAVADSIETTLLSWQIFVNAAK